MVIRCSGSNPAAILCDGRCGAGEGCALNEPMLKTDPAAISSVEFFDRSRARWLRRAAGPDRSQHHSKSGDQGTDRMLEIIAREQPVRPAAALDPGGGPSAAHRAADPARGASQRSRRPDCLPRRQDRCDRRFAARRALREAEEEIGLDRQFVEPLGYLDLYATGFGFRILPTVRW